MAYRELGVIEVREVWRRYCAGDGVRAIARGTGVDRKTIAKYVAAADAVGLSRGDPPPTEEQLAAVVAGSGGRPWGGRPRCRSGSRRYHAQIEAWLAEGLRLTKIYRRLREQGVSVPYSSLHRFAQAHCGFGTPAITVRVAEPPPGEAAEADFGRLGCGRIRPPASGGASTASWSRWPQPVRLPRHHPPPGPAPVLEGLEAAWAFFGGVVKRLVVDNLKPAVTRPDRYTPQIDRVFLEYAQFRGFLVDPAVVRHATGKPRWSAGSPMPARTTSAARASATSTTCSPAP